MNFGLLVWSYSRPAQLDLLLSSLERFCPNQFATYVLYKAEGEFIDGYNLCKRYHPNANFVPETDFCGQTKELLRQHKYMGVSTDDTVVFKSFYLTEDDMMGVDTFSLRYGLNTIVQDPFSGRKQPTLNRFLDEGRTISWDIRNHHPLNNYGFIMGHDLHVYSQKYTELVSRLNFKKANQLESLLFDLRDKISPFIRSFKESVAVNIPGNNTSGYTETDNSLPLPEVNKKFLRGLRFNLNDVTSQKIVGCHQLMPVSMIGRGGFV